MTQLKIEGVGHGIPRTIFGSDGSNWYAILVDSDGHVKIDVVTYPGVNALGNKPFGYNAQYLDFIYTDNATGGDNLLYGTAVSTGEIWVVSIIASWDENNNPTSIEVGMYEGGRYYPFKVQLAPGALIPVCVTGPFYLVSGDQVYAYLSGCVLNDNIRLTANGYKMKIA